MAASSSSVGGGGVGTSSGIVFRLAEHFRKDSTLHRITGGTHSCYIRFGDGNIRSFEDIGRHNALDKAVGAMLLVKEDPGKCMLYTSGRVPQDMVEKVIHAGIPILISKAVPTDRSIRLAAAYGLKLIVRAHADSYEEISGENFPGPDECPLM